MVSMRWTAPSRQLAHGAEHLGVSGVADQEHLAPGLVEPLGLAMDLGDQRTGGVEIEQAAAPRRLRHRFRHPVGGEDHGRIGVRDFVQFFDEDGALGSERFHHVAVMDDLVTHIDWRAISGERQLDDLDGAVDAGAEAPRRREIDGQGEEACVRPDLVANAGHRRPGIGAKRLKFCASRALSGLRTGISLAPNSGQPASRTSSKPSWALFRGISGGDARRVKLRTGIS